MVTEMSLALLVHLIRSNNGAVDMAMAAGGGGLSFMDVLIVGQHSLTNSFDIPVHFATTDEIGAAADGSPTQEINIGHAEGVAAMVIYCS